MQNSCPFRSELAVAPAKFQNCMHGNDCDMFPSQELTFKLELTLRESKSSLETCFKFRLAVFHPDTYVSKVPHHFNVEQHQMASW